MNFLKQSLAVAVLLLSYKSFAQKNEGESKIFKRLHLGDTVPEVILNQLYNSNKTSGKLSDFKAKALILDFWNRGCSGCIQAMPKMEQLRDQFKDSLQVLMVTWQPIEEFNSLFKNSQIVKRSKLPMAFNAHSLYNYLFPHNGEPYHVWIDKNGIVRGMTSGEFATVENVKDLIAGGVLKIPLKEHLLLTEKDSELPRLLVNNGELAKYVLLFNKIQNEEDAFLNKIDTVRIGKSLIDLKAPYYSMIMKSLYHLGGGGAASSAIYDPITGKSIGYKDGGSLVGLYQLAYNVPHDTKVILDGKSKQYYDPGKNATPLEKEKYYRNAHFIYELAYPGIISMYDDKSRAFLKRDLEYVFGLKGSLELRKLECLILFRTFDADKLTSKGGLEVYEDTKSSKGFIFNNISFGTLGNQFRLLKDQEDGPVFIDESGIDYMRKVDMVLHVKMDDIAALNLELKKYGLGIRRESRLMPAFVLREIN